MAWVRSKLHRNSIVYADSAQPQKRRLISTLTPIGYTDANGDIQQIDMTPEAVADGWQIVNNGWHYHLNRNGTVSFGGRRGAHWFRFRLHRVGYTQVDQGSTPDFASDYTDIGGAPTYNTTNLSRTVQSKTVTDGVINVGAVAEWRNIWTPPQGEIYARWALNGDRLKEDIVITQAAREWIVANRPPSFYGLTASQTWLTFAFQIDFSDVPRRILRGVGDVTGSTDFSDTNGELEARTALDELLFFMPLDDAYVDDAEGIRHSVRLRKRFWRNAADGQWYLVVGAKVADLAALPAGDLIFDPTINESVGASTDDADNFFGDRLTTDRMWMGRANGPVTSGMRFDNIAISGSDTVDSVTVTLVAYSSSWSEIYDTWNFEAADDAATFSTGSMPDDRTLVASAGIQDIHNFSKTGGVAYDFPRTTANAEALGALLQNVIDRDPGWVSGNAIVLLNCHPSDTNLGSGNGHEYATYDHATYAAPAITIEYTAGAGGQNASGGVAEANAEAFSGTAAAGAVSVDAGVSSASAQAFDGTAQAGAIAADGTTASATAQAFDADTVTSVGVDGTTATAHAEALDGSTTVGGVNVSGGIAEANAQAFDGTAQPGAITAAGQAAIANAEALPGSAAEDVQAVSGTTAEAHAAAFDGSTTVGTTTVSGLSAVAQAEAFVASYLAGAVSVDGTTAEANAEALDGQAIPGGQLVDADSATANAEALDGSATSGLTIVSGTTAEAAGQAYAATTTQGGVSVSGGLAEARTMAYAGTAREVLSPGLATITIVQRDAAGVTIMTTHAISIWIGAE